MLSSTESIATISSMLHGEYGIDDVCISIPTLVGPNGVKGKLTVPLTDEELEKLHNSAKVLKNVINQLTL